MNLGGGPTDPRRRSARHPTDEMRCQIGQVVDLSASGMRILCKGKPPMAVGQMIDLKLHFADGAISLRGQAMWYRRSGLRRYEVGIRFVNLKPAVAKSLESLAKFGFFGGSTTSGSGSFTRTGSGGRGRITAAIGLPDYYRVLGVSPYASLDDIKSAFRRLATRYHPDVAKEPNAAEMFTKVHEAYEVLKDPERRAMYDLRTAA